MELKKRWILFGILLILLVNILSIAALGSGAALGGGINIPLGNQTFPNVTTSPIVNNTLNQNQTINGNTNVQTNSNNQLAIDLPTPRGLSFTFGDMTSPLTVAPYKAPPYQSCRAT